jgi:hypothetical protein
MGFLISACYLSPRPMKRYLVSTLVAAGCIPTVQPPNADGCSVFVVVEVEGTRHRVFARDVSGGRYDFPTLELSGSRRVYSFVYECPLSTYEIDRKHLDHIEWEASAVPGLGHPAPKSAQVMTIRDGIGGDWVTTSTDAVPVDLGTAPRCPTLQPVWTATISLNISTAWALSDGERVLVGSTLGKIYTATVAGLRTEPVSLRARAMTKAGDRYYAIVESPEDVRIYQGPRLEEMTRGDRVGINAAIAIAVNAAGVVGVASRDEALLLDDGTVRRFPRCTPSDACSVDGDSVSFATNGKDFFHGSSSGSCIGRYAGKGLQSETLDLECGVAGLAFADGWGLLASVGPASLRRVDVSRDVAFEVDVGRVAADRRTAWVAGTSKASAIFREQPDTLVEVGPSCGYPLLAGALFVVPLSNGALEVRAESVSLHAWEDLNACTCGS